MIAKKVACPVPDCPFEASPQDVAVHLDECRDEKHDWELIGFKDGDEFQRRVSYQYLRRHFDEPVKDVLKIYRQLRYLLSRANRYTSKGDRAFKQSNHETALEQYESASLCYEVLEEIAQEFSCESAAGSFHVCSVCDKRISEVLLYWEVTPSQRLELCQSCAWISATVKLPTLDDAKSTHEVVKDNIENLHEGSHGLDWTSSSPTPVMDSSGQKGESVRNTQLMLVQLTGVIQTIGRLPSAEVLDEQTDFGYLEYRNEFGSILDAAREAGFDV
ncbi:hypothetical protein [Haloprofundus halobius]|uniref:hypothetical protein n=1 Tax=Haloprofundus halobius TaxID=2876194 RepID=UPI001CCE69AB|nr:hypothetical protein [Haloprofundus halobius]